MAKQTTQDIILAMIGTEKLGIHTEDVVETSDKIIIYFSVPKRADMYFKEFKNKTYAESDELIEIGKQILSEITIESVKIQLSDFELSLFSDEEIKETLIFKAKVRDEIWTEGHAKSKEADIASQLKSIAGYKQV